MCRVIQCHPIPGIKIRLLNLAYEVLKGWALTPLHPPRLVFQVPATLWFPSSPRCPVLITDQVSAQGQLPREAVPGALLLYESPLWFMFVSLFVSVTGCEGREVGAHT